MTRKDKLQQATLLFSVIYSFDIPSNISVNAYKPPKPHLWELTESGPSEFDTDTPWKHRKYCALLTKDEFKEFMHHCNLRADSVETMGSIGAPGFGDNWAPAISCACYDYGYDDSFATAYVTPIPNKRIDQADYQSYDRDFKRVKRAMLAMF
jgi:hypothetical protein